MATITEDYVTLEVARLLEKKGFDGECRNYIDGNSTYKMGYYVEKPITSNKLKSGETLLPTLQMACKWLKEAHKIYIDISPTYSEVEKTIHFIWQIFDSNYDVVGDCEIFYSEPETACEAAIKYCLEHLI